MRETDEHRLCATEMVADVPLVCNPGLTSMHAPEVKPAAEICEIDELVVCASELVIDAPLECNPGMSSMHAPGFKSASGVLELAELVLCAPETVVDDAADAKTDLAPGVEGRSSVQQSPGLSPEPKMSRRK